MTDQNQASNNGFQTTSNDSYSHRAPQHEDEEENEHAAPRPLLVHERPQTAVQRPTPAARTKNDGT